MVSLYVISLKVAVSKNLWTMLNEDLMQNRLPSPMQMGAIQFTEGLNRIERQRKVGFTLSLPDCLIWDIDLTLPFLVYLFLRSSDMDMNLHHQHPWFSRSCKILKRYLYLYPKPNLPFLPSQTSPAAVTIVPSTQTQII